MIPQNSLFSSEKTQVDASNPGPFWLVSLFYLRYVWLNLPVRDRRILITIIPVIARSFNSGSGQLAEVGRQMVAIAQSFQQWTVDAKLHKADGSYQSRDAIAISPQINPQ